MSLYTIKITEALCPKCKQKAELRVDNMEAKQRVYMGCSQPEHKCGWISREIT